MILYQGILQNKIKTTLYILFYGSDLRLFRKWQAQAALHSLGNISGETRTESNILLNADAEENLRRLIYETASKTSKLTPSVSVFFSKFSQFSCRLFCNFSHIVWCIIYGVCYWHFPSSGLGNNCISHFTINFSNCLQVKTKLEQLAGSFPISSSTGFRSSLGGENFVCVYF